jgi:hypothetical protein
VIAVNANANLTSTIVLPFTVSIIVTDTNFTTPLPLTLSQTGNLLSSVGGVDANLGSIGYYGANNQPFNVSGANSGTATSNLTDGVAINTPATNGVATGATPYSLTTAFFITMTSRGSDPIQNIQFNGNLTATGVPGNPLVPEPASVLTLSGGLVFLSAGLLRKKLRK